MPCFYRSYFVDGVSKALKNGSSMVRGESGFEESVPSRGSSRKSSIEAAGGSNNLDSAFKDQNPSVTTHFEKKRFSRYLNRLEFLNATRT